jgi:hypothetical protein
LLVRSVLDHVHFNFTGITRWRRLADQVISLLPEPPAIRCVNRKVLTETECAERLPSEWDQRSFGTDAAVHWPPFLNSSTTRTDQRLGLR